MLLPLNLTGVVYRLRELNHSNIFVEKKGNPRRMCQLFRVNTVRDPLSGVPKRLLPSVTANVVNMELIGNTI